MDLDFCRLFCAESKPVAVVIFRNKKTSCRPIPSVQFFFAAQKGIVQGKVQIKKFLALDPPFSIFFTVYCAPSIVLIACYKTDPKIP